MRYLGAAGAPAFERGDPDAELAQRVARLQARMERDGLDALLLTTEANVRYTTGYHSPFWQSPTRPWFVVLPREGEPTAVVPTIGADAFARARVGRVMTWPSPRPSDEGVGALVEVISPLCNRTGRVGAELGTEMTLRMPQLDFEALRRRLQALGVEVVDGSDAIRRSRLVKSPLEVAKVGAACEAMSRAYDILPSVVRAGMTEVQLCNVVKRLFLEQGADDAPYVICRSGPGSYSDIIGHPTGRALQDGDLLIIDSGCQVDGYFCDFNRNFAVGQPSPEAAEAFEAVSNATNAALRAVRPGVAVKDVHRAMAASMGVSLEGGVGRMGHSVGLQLTEWPSIHPDEATVLEEGMLLSIEPSIDLKSGGGRFVVTEEVVEVTAFGPRLLSSRAPEAIPSLREAGLGKAVIAEAAAKAAPERFGECGAGAAANRTTCDA